MKHTHNEVVWEKPHCLAAYKVGCEECGKPMDDLYTIPRGFRVLCQKCYEDFKLRKQPWTMWYKLKPPVWIKKQENKLASNNTEKSKEEKV